MTRISEKLKDAWVRERRPFRSKVVVFGYLHQWDAVSDFYQFGLIEDVHAMFRAPVLAPQSEKVAGQT